MCVACRAEKGSLLRTLGLEEEQWVLSRQRNNINTRDFTSLHTLVRLGPSFLHVDDKDDLGASAWDL